MGNISHHVTYYIAMQIGVFHKQNIHNINVACVKDDVTSSHALAVASSLKVTSLLWRVEA